MEQSQETMGQMAAKFEGRIHREVFSCIKWPYLKSPPSTLSSIGHQNEFQKQPNSFGKRDCLLAGGTAESLESRRVASPLVLYKYEGLSLRSLILELLLFFHYSAVIFLILFYCSYCCTNLI